MPYVALQYRRRGTVGAGHLALAATFGLYLVALAFFVILPLRPVTPDFCLVHGVDPQWNPFQLLGEVRAERAIGGWRAVLGNADAQQFALNVFLFIPLGLFVRHLLRRGVMATIAIGFAVSLAIELTQLTGDWGLYPCAYRFFETNDLLTNTLGAAVGAVIAPLLRAVPAQLTLVHPERAQPVTALRRLLAAVCDAAVVALAGLFLLALAGLVLEATRGQLFESGSARAELLRASTLVAAPGAVLLLAVPLLWRGRTIGEWAVLLHPIDRGGQGLSQAQIAGRFLTGPAPIMALAVAGLLGAHAAWPLAALVIGFHIGAIVLAGSGRGGVGARLGLLIADARAGPPQGPE